MDIELTGLEKTKIKSPSDAYHVMQPKLLQEDEVNRDREHFWVISLNQANRLLDIHLVSLGTVSGTLVNPTEVFCVPMQKRAVKVILVHNHPSGEIKPSDEDIDRTDQLIRTGRTMNIPVVDHLIITERSYFSFGDDGLMKKLEGSLKYANPYEIKKRYKNMAWESREKLGRKNERRETARRMKSNGEPIEKIMKYTGLPKWAIDRIKVKKE
jgi:DNA repair protein RadC